MFAPIHNEFMRAPRGVLLRTRTTCYALFHVVQLQLSIAVDLRYQRPSYVMDRPTLSPSKVEKAREAIDYLSSLSLPQASSASSHRTVEGSGSNGSRDKNGKLGSDLGCQWVAC